MARKELERIKKNMTTIYLKGQDAIDDYNQLSEQQKFALYFSIFLQEAAGHWDKWRNAECFKKWRSLKIGLKKKFYMSIYHVMIPMENQDDPPELRRLIQSALDSVSTEAK